MMTGSLRGIAQARLPPRSNEEVEVAEVTQDPEEVEVDVVHQELPAPGEADEGVHDVTPDEVAEAGDLLWGIAKPATPPMMR